MPLPEELRGRSLTRREMLAYFGMLGAGAYVSKPAAAWARSARPAQVIRRAASVKAAGSDLEAVEHIIFLMMENRSYDHYFGAYPRGRGFDDHKKHSLSVFAQNYPFPAGAGLYPEHKLLPFHLDSLAGMECTDDLTHAWEPQHLCWNHGKMDSWVKIHASPGYEGEFGAMTMGYYERADLPFYYAVADAFTLCDAYHCSILGPTHPNRLMANSGTIDPAGTMGGPVTQTNGNPDFQWNCKWPTIQEVLEDAGVAWKVYNPSNVDLPAQYLSLAQYPGWNPAFYNPVADPEVLGVGDNILPYFTAFRNTLSPLYQKAFNPTFPGDFSRDVASGQLPSVSWLCPPIGFDEHPSSSAINGQYYTSMVLEILASNPAVWSKTALFLMYDENDGWFDHVPPPVAPHGTPGEYLTAPAPAKNDPDANNQSIVGPLGLGVRVPMLVMSPFSRGGHIASEVFDHTSQMQLVGARFGVEVPNVSAWRRETVGDLTSTLFRGPSDAQMPDLPETEVYLPGNGECSWENQDTDSGGAGPSVPTKQRMPKQGGGTTPASFYFPAKTKKKKKKHDEIDDDHRTPINVPHPRPVTEKSSYNTRALVRR
jgi:phospholipase C